MWRLSFLPFSFFFSNLSNLFGLSKSHKLFKLTKFSLFFAPLLLLSYTQGSQALTSHTSRKIEGNAPYLTFDGGLTKVTSTDNLLAIELPDGRTLKPSTNTSSSRNPIKLVNGTTFNDIHMVVPLSVNTVSLNDLITQGNWGDDDGDGQGTNGVTATGSVSVSFTDADNNTVSRSEALDICKVPYKMTLSSTGGGLQTKYGLPNTRNFSSQTVTYYINPYGGTRICFVRPNTNGSVFKPSSMVPNKGFLVQSTSSSSYGLNFPTMGGDGLYFDLLIAGVDASQLTWPSVSRGGITARVSWRLPKQGEEEDAWIYEDDDRSSYVTRVTLTGPKASDAQMQSDNPSPLTVPSLPQTFELVGRDSSGNEVRYGFVLRQWFVHRGTKQDYWSNQISWCGRLGYRAPKLKELTNAKCGSDNRFPCYDGIDGATPSSNTWYNTRYIGAGFFTEWGDLGHYYIDGGSNFIGFWDSSWTSDATDSGVHFIVYGGDVRIRDGSYREHIYCTTP
ncbi:hypothetical protein [Gilliamella sp. ESL0250]|uniref:hypothetical protein n=1 Tax=Gilliamella sp. ESL0250 TaxID=2705036 RepID=UPI00158118F8|nr:hypothetical protein [Gilliamella sp. ESL0250]NUF49327.1 hypothetical protein [Gilliamella sp. ESL0250]